MSTSSDQIVASDLKAFQDSFDQREPFSGQKALVTGGAGFIGSWICDFLISQGASVICVDDMSTGLSRNIVSLGRNSRFKFLRTDVGKGLKPSVKCDLIFHLASHPSPEEYQKHPIETALTNSEGTRNILEIARKNDAPFLFASSSEVYGDAKVVPTPETYWGNVNPIGPRSCYDEGKRFGEALCMAYHRAYGLDVRITRIFNSIPGNEKVFFLNDNEFHMERIDQCEQRISKGGRVKVPAFDPGDGRVKIYPVSKLHRHPYTGDLYSIETTYGRRVRVTGDHSLFTRAPNGKAVPTFARLLRKGDYVGIPTRIRVPVRDFTKFRVAQSLPLNERQSWKLMITSPRFRQIIQSKQKRLLSCLEASRHFKPAAKRQTFRSMISRYAASTSLPLPLIRRLKIKVPDDAKVRVYWGGKQHWIPNLIQLDDDLLWLVGFFLAEGFKAYARGKCYAIGFASDEYLLVKAARILRTKFNVHITSTRAKTGRPPTIRVNSLIVFEVFEKILKLFEAGVPLWVLQLPLRKLERVLEGYKDGDGTHSGKSVGRLLDFNTSRRRMADDISLLLMRFGLVAMVKRYTTTFRRRYGARRFPFYRISLRGLSSYRIHNWHKGVKQNLTARRTGHIAWARAKKIRRMQYSGTVYDFSVPAAENFVAGSGVFCHNTYGPRLRADGLYARALSRFIRQALSGSDVTVYGKGDQTRSFCYVTDTVLALLLAVEKRQMRGQVANVGNPRETTILSLAERIIKITKSKSKISFHQRPQDDPQRRCPDIARSRALLSWSPRVSLKDGLSRTIEWFRVSRKH